MMKTLLMNPHSFFRNQATRPTATGPVLLVLGTGLITTLSSLIPLYYLTQNMSGGASAFTSVAYLIGSFSGILTIFAVWLINAGVIFLLSTYFDGEGPFRRLLLLIGWGYLPNAILGVAALFVMWQVTLTTTPPQDLTSAQAYMQQIQNHRYLWVNKLITVVITLWQGFLWVFAVKHARQLDLKQAFICVAVPTALSIAYTASTLL